MVRTRRGRRGTPRGCLSFTIRGLNDQQKITTEADRRPETANCRRPSCSSKRVTIRLVGTEQAAKQTATEIILHFNYPPLSRRCLSGSGFDYFPGEVTRAMGSATRHEKDHSSGPSASCIL